MTIADRNTRNLIIAFSAITVISVVAGMAGNWYFLLGIPALALYAYLAVVDFKQLFFLLMACLPITVEVWLPNGTVTDIPTEPMMVSLMGIYLLYVLRNGATMKAGFLRHPITMLLLLHMAWMFFTVLTSQAFVVSLKWFLAKCWYVTTFYFLAGSILRSEKDLKKVLWVVLPPLLLTVVYVTVRHAAYGFSFAEVYKVMHPFYRNKVMYACMLVVFMPFVWYGLKWYKRYSFAWFFLVFALVLMLVGVQFSYTRAAYVSLVLAAGAYYVIKWRLMKPAIGFAAIGAVLFIASQLKDRHWLDEKPVYEKTITYDRFEDLLSATTKGQDVSTMERVYRWVAGGHMVAERPLTGFGPGTFTTFYKSYTVAGFRTYVSENKEGSGIHCYYLQTLVDQGFPGALLFILLVVVVLLKAESVYHKSSSPERKRVVLMVALTTVIIDSLLLMNDLVETDKVGSFFFLSMAVIVNMDLEERKEG
ncbi:MAG: hypothetical protein Kow0027_06720 [Saprospiraceae bacterium]